MQKWETHLHTKNGSGCGQVSTRNVAKIYAKAGYDGIVVTNHFNLTNFQSYYKGRKINWVGRFLKEYRSLKKHCAKYGITVLLGLEMCLAGDEYTKDKPEYSELLVYGITPEELDDASLDAASGAGRYTVRRYFRDGKLYITVDSSVVRSQLSFQRDVLLEKINALLAQDELFTCDDPRSGCVKELILK